MSTTKTAKQPRPADLAASAERVRRMVLAAGVPWRVLQDSETRVRDNLSQQDLADLGAPEVDMLAEWNAAGLTYRQRRGLARFRRRASDVDQAILDWHVACRAATACLLTGRRDHSSDVRAARARVWAASQGAAP